MSSPGHVTVIAEAGVNHNGSLDTAKALAEAAKDAGADFVKYQTFNPELLVTASAGTAAYQAEGGYTDQRAMLASLALSPDELQMLKRHCDEIGISFLSTAFDSQSVELLSSIGQTIWKIPSGEITNSPLVSLIGSIAHSVVLSTGMATLGEIEQCLSWLDAAGCPSSDVTVLHCNTQYPTPMRDVNLRAMATIAEAFGVAVGYSDHTMGIEVPIAAVALGASVIEKHFTLDRDQQGPDHKASLTPVELTAMIKALRNVEEALGSSRKLVSESEYANREIVRKSIVAARPVRAGDLLTPDNITTKRPGTGISAVRWEEVLGRTASRDYQPDDFIEW